MTELEQKALNLKNLNYSDAEIETQLKAEFIFFKTLFSDSYHHATLWRKVN